jgi:acyl carrier protein
MTRQDLLLQMDEILGVRPGTIRGTEPLDELENWDSMALISFIAMAEQISGANVSLNQVVNCATVADLLKIAKLDGESVMH